MSVQVIDHAVPEGLAEDCRQWLSRQTMLFGWKARRDSPGLFWHRNYVLPGTYRHHYDDGTWNPSMSYDAFVASRNPLAQAAQIICDQYFNKQPLTRVWVNAQSFGDEAAFHRDFPLEFKGTAKTAVWYPVAQWERDWGGDFVTLTDDGEVDACCLVKPNRLVMFNGTQQHSARPISRYCPELRVAVSFGCEVTCD